MQRSLEQIGQNFENRISSELVYHGLFWLAFFFFLVIFNNSAISLGSKFLVSTIHITFYAGLVYFNLFFLFKKFMAHGKIAIYIIGLLLVVLAITPIKNYLLHQNLMLDKFYTTFLSCFFIGSMSSIYLIFNDWFRQKSEKQLLQQQTLRSELNFLKTQINPHFLFNTLNSLYALTLKKSDDAPNIVLRLSEMMRYMLYECNEKLVDLHKEINYLNNYLELEKIRHSGKFDINFEVTGDVNQQKIAPLLFIPFIENSFKHGMNNQLKDGYVNINLDVQDDSISLQVSNNKSPQIPSANKKKSGGIGLANVKKRLNLLYPDDHELKIEDAPNEYKIELALNI